jgi:phosphoglycerate dehydrogenase-like enzyme
MPANALLVPTCVAALVIFALHRRRRRLCGPSSGNSNADTTSPPTALFFGPAQEFRDHVAQHLETHWNLELACDDDKERLAQQARTATALIGGLQPANELLRQSGPNLRLMQCHFTGTDWLAASALPKQVVLCNAGCMETPIAEWVSAAMLHFVVQLPKYDLDMRTRMADAARTQSDTGFAPPFFQTPKPPFRSELSSMCVGVIGMGKIGAAIASRAAAFGCTVVGVVGRMTPQRKRPASLRWLRGPDGLVDLLKESDFVVLACPLSDATRGLIGAAQLAMMKPTAVLINIARGGVVDEAALYEALSRSVIGGAAIDVWWRLPNVAEGQTECAPCRLSDHPFHSLPNVLLSNHTSSWSEEQIQRRHRVIAGNLDAIRQGRPLRSVVQEAAQ